jgi:hypothetical protein
MLSDFENKTVLGSYDLKGIQNFRKIAIELHIDDGTDNL